MEGRKGEKKGKPRSKALKLLFALSTTSGNSKAVDYLPTTTDLNYKIKTVKQ